MANRRKGPRMIQEILRLNQKGIGKKKIAKALGISRNTVKRYLQEAQGNPPGLDPGTPYRAPWSVSMDWEAVQRAMNQGTSLSVWWEENVAPQKPLAPLPYVSFWREWRRRYPNIDLDFHKHHPPGERCEVDYKGKAPGLGFVDRRTGEFIECRLFGSILCFSQLFYAEATLHEKQPNFLGAIENSFQFFGGVPQTLIPDNTRSAVVKAHRYDPDQNPEFTRFCAHYQTVALPTRPYQPKDKNLIENALGVFWRWARPKIQERTFFSLAELNQFLKELLVRFNERIQKKTGLSRRQKFEAGEKEKLLAFPEHPFESADWKKAKVHADCHVQVGRNFYSAPYPLRGKHLDVRITPSFIELYHQLERVALHHAYPSNQRGQYRRDPQHLPEAHKAILEMTPQKILEEAQSVGPQTHDLIQRLLTQSRHPLMYLRRTQGILRLKKRYSKEELEKVATLLNQLQQKFPKLRDLEAFLKNPQRQMQLPPTQKEVHRNPNPNLRGRLYWSHPKPLTPKEEEKETMLLKPIPPPCCVDPTKDILRLLPEKEEKSPSGSSMPPGRSRPENGFPIGLLLSSLKVTKGLARGQNEAKPIQTKEGEKT